MQKKKGISLIVLVITIIVMIILAGSIIITLSNSGIINKANEAVDLTNDKQMQEYITSELILNDWYTGKPVTKELLEKIDGVTVTEAEVEGAWIIDKDGVKTTIYKTGDIVKGETKLWTGEASAPEIKNGNWYIYTPEQLKFLADAVNGGNVTEGYKIEETTTVYLMNDLDLGARHQNGTKTVGTEWTPIGSTEALKFIGTFEGNNYTIRGVYVSIENNFAGIFGNANTIQNLTIKDSYIKTTVDCAGGIVAAGRVGQIINCHNINTPVIARYIVGGVVGQFTGTEMLNCSNNGVVDAGASNKGIADAGGVVGRSRAVKIENCNNSGFVSGLGREIGGIVGTVLEPTSKETPTVNNCKSSGNVVGKSEDDKGDKNISGNVGGIIGKEYLGTNIINCKNNGTIKSSGNRIGGIVGDTYSNGKIEKCINTGNVEGNGYAIGGIVGALFTKLEICYNTGNIKSTGSSNQGDGDAEFGVYGIGGIVGACGNTGIIVVKNTYNSGMVNVEGSEVHGISGIVGATSRPADSLALTVSNNYNIGKNVITGNNPIDVGGVIGWKEGESPLTESDNYYIEGTLKTEGNNFGESKTSAEMKTEAFVTLLNTGLATAAWEIRTGQNSGYPVLIGLK